jgi:hypothetical protein
MRIAKKYVPEHLDWHPSAVEYKQHLNDSHILFPTLLLLDGWEFAFLGNHRVVFFAPFILCIYVYNSLYI